MRLVATYEQLNQGFDRARSALLKSPELISFSHGNDERSFSAATPSRPSRRLQFSYPLGLRDENRLSHIGLDANGELCFLRQSPVERLPGKGFGFAKQAGLAFVPTRRAASLTDPVWLDFGTVDSEDFAEVFATRLATYFDTWDALKLQMVSQPS